MRFASFSVNGEAAWGRLHGEQAVVLTGAFPTLRAAIENDALHTPELQGASGPVVDLATLSWLPVIPEPGKILCVGLNYEDHRRETGRSEVAHPTIFTRFADSQAAHGSPILMPRVSDKLDFEGELAVVIGRGGRYIARSEAMSHIAGYSCYNDATVRDWQAHTTQFTPGKNFPRTGSFGPWLVTADEFRPDAQRLQTRLNGAIMQQALLSQMIFPIERLIEYCSSFTSLAPGDVIVSGTPGGVGAKRNPPVFMREGDRIEIEIEGLATLSNVIARE